MHIFPQFLRFINLNLNLKFIIYSCGLIANRETAILNDIKLRGVLNQRQFTSLLFFVARFQQLKKKSTLIKRSKCGSKNVNCLIYGWGLVGAGRRGGKKETCWWLLRDFYIKNNKFLVVNAGRQVWTNFWWRSLRLKCCFENSKM